MIDDEEKNTEEGGVSDGAIDEVLEEAAVDDEADPLMETGEVEEDKERDWA